MVVGYGTQKKKAVTAAITKVDVTEIKDLVTTSFDRQLAGRAAGVQVTVPSGLTNQEPRIRIRGVNSISYGRDPLIVGRLRALAARNTWRIRAREAMQLIEARSAEPPASPTMASPHP